MLLLLLLLLMSSSLIKTDGRGTKSFGNREMVIVPVVSFWAVEPKEAAAVVKEMLLMLLLVVPLCSSPWSRPRLLISLLTLPLLFILIFTICAAGGENPSFNKLRSIKSVHKSEVESIVDAAVVLEARAAFPAFRNPPCPAGAGAAGADQTTLGDNNIVINNIRSHEVDRMVVVVNILVGQINEKWVDWSIGWFFSSKRK